MYIKVAKLSDRSSDLCSHTVQLHIDLYATLNLVLMEGSKTWDVSVSLSVHVYVSHSKRDEMMIIYQVLEKCTHILVRKKTTMFFKRLLTISNISSKILNNRHKTIQKKWKYNVEKDFVAIRKCVLLLLKKKVHTFIRASIYSCTYKCVHIYIYTHTNASICLYVYMYVLYMYICVLFAKWDLKKKKDYYFTVKIEMMVFTNFVPVIVKRVSFFCLGCK